MKYIFFSYEKYCASIAQKLIDEGNEVDFAQIEDKEDTLIEEEKKPGAGKEDPELKKRRLALFDGIIKKLPAKKVIKAMAELKNKDDYFFMTDINNSFKYAEEAEKMGYAVGFFPHEEDRQMEVDRNMGKEIVKENYEGIFVKDYKEFKKAKDGIAYLEGNKNIYVLKSLGDSGETVVPKGNDPELENQIIIDVLEKDSKSYETNGFLLEQKIMDAVEFTPEIIFWNGEPICTTIDIETKTKDAGELGVNVGCGFNLIVRTELDDKINKICFPQYVHDKAKERKGMFVWDMGILVDKKDGKMYFTEFCPNRVGWDAFPTELAMSGDPDGEQIATPFFEKLVKGENPLRWKFGVGIRIFNDNTNHDRYPAEELSIQWDDKTSPDLYLYDAQKKDDKYMTVGYQSDLGVVTGVGDTLGEAIDKAYAYVKMVSFKDMSYRDYDDFVSMSYSQAVMRRLSYIIEQGLIKTDDAEAYGSGKKFNLHGYDIDGVLTEGVEPKKPYVVISGRTIGAWEKTLKDIGEDAPIYLRPYGEPGNVYLSARWKSEMIQRLGVGQFTEDDPTIVEILKRENPSVEIIHYTNENNEKYYDKIHSS